MKAIYLILLLLLAALYFSISGNHSRINQILFEFVFWVIIALVIWYWRDYHND